jgi:PIN domain nuclease of toxin-antitoxin system
MDIYTLDACAVIAMLWKEPGGDVVARIFKQASKAEVLMNIHAVTMIEIYNKIYNEMGSAQADQTYQRIAANPSLAICDSTNGSFLRKFSEIKKKYSTHFTDTFVITTNEFITYQGTIITADHGFDKYKEDNPHKVLYFR